MKRPLASISAGGLIASLLGAGMLLFLAGCGGGATSTGGGGNPVPTITAISPTSAVAGGASGFTLTVNGTNFVSASVVNFAGTARTTTLVSSTQLTATIPAAATASAGTAAVIVTNPAPGGGTSNAVNFTISASNPVPTITTISPASAVAGSPAGFMLTVNGTNFVAASLVTFGGTTRTTTFVTSTQLTASIDAAAIAAPGTMTVTVTNPAPGGGTSNPVNFTISGGPNPVPTISSLSPNVATFGGPAFTLTVYDTVGNPSFVPGSVIRWNGTDRLTAFGSSFRLTAQIPASDIAATGTAAVAVFNPAPGGGVSNSLTFTIAPGGVFPVSVAIAPDSTGKFGKFAYVANAITNNVSMYAIDPTTGALTSRGTIAAGTYPFSTAVDPSGKFAYVANALSNDVSTYTIDAATGALTSTGAAAAGTLPESVAVDPSGKFAYVADTVGCVVPGLGEVSMYTINADGTLALKGTIGPGPCPSSVAVDPLGKFAYAANEGDCGDFLVSSVSIYKINPAFNGILSLTGTIDAGACPVSVAVAPDPSGRFGGFAYVVDSEIFPPFFYGVFMYTIDPTTGNLTPIGSGSVVPGTQPRSVAVDPSGKFAYVTNSGSNNVSMYTINPINGALTPIGVGTIPAGTSPASVAVDPSGKFAYVTNSGSNDISMYSIGTVTGALTLIGTIGT
jgi:6-phosphogluconolactonase (cycloisomerase 2 family)